MNTVTKRALGSLAFTLLLTAGLIAAGAGVPSITLAAHAATPVTATAVTNLHQRPDSGFGGNTWALDKITRTATVTLVGPDSTLTDCGAAATACFTYTGHISDTGTAFADTGAVSPGSQAVPIKGSPTAAIAGSTDVNFHASSGTPDAALVPGGFTGPGGVSTTDWVEQFFPAGTTFGTPSLPDWSWTYTDAVNCQAWVDAFNVSKADSGDITGVSACPKAPAPVKLSAGKAVRVSGAHAAVSWQQSGPAYDKVTINGPGPLGGHTGWIHVTAGGPVTGNVTGMLGGHSYTVTIQPETSYTGPDAGTAGRIYIPRS